MRFSVVFQNYKSGKKLTKSFRTEKTAKKAKQGITKKTSNMFVCMKKSKGFKFKKGFKNIC